MILDLYKIRVEEAIEKYIDQMGKSSRLDEACAYSLTNGGKRLRPILTLITAEALGTCDVMPAALGVEFFHTASLIADDLPCMDDDAQRRRKASLHVAFEESTALLTSYTLIACGYGAIYENAKKMRKSPLYFASADKRAMECLDAATMCAKKATQGQFFDLFPPNPTPEVIYDVINKKTVTLFEISFLFGWLFGGGDLASIPRLKKCAYHLGMAFQIADDLEDGEQDSEHMGINIASVLGKDKALACFEEEMESLENAFKDLGLLTEPFQEILGYLYSIHK